MNFDTVKEILNKVLLEIGLVPGSSVQKYTEPEILNAIQTSFDFLFEKRFWKHLTYTSEHTLDTEIGVITDALERVRQFNDIEWIKHEPFSDSCKLIAVEDETEAEQFYSSLCYYPLSFGQEHFETKLFKVFPVSPSQKIKVRARRYPSSLKDLDDIVPFDPSLFFHLVCVQVLAKDGMSPNLESFHQNLFNLRYVDIVSSDATKPLHFSFSNRSKHSSTFTVAEE